MVTTKDISYYLHDLLKIHMKIKDFFDYVNAERSLNKGPERSIEGYVKSSISDGISIYDLITNAFIWQKTSEGIEYWRIVDREWRTLVERWNLYDVKDDSYESIW